MKALLLNAVLTLVRWTVFLLAVGVVAVIMIYVGAKVQ